MVRVVDTVAPAFTSLTASPNVLTPVNNKMVPVTLSASLSDVADAAPRARVIGITSNEPPATSDAPDWEITSDLTVALRAARNGTGSGRIYTIIVEAADAHGNTTRASVNVTVPHN